MTEGERGIANLRAFILRHESRFERLDGDIPKDRVGFVRDGFYFFTREGFTEALAGANKAETLQALDDSGLLIRKDSRHRTSSITVSSEKIYGYKVKSSILSGEGGETLESMRPTGFPTCGNESGEGGEGGAAVHVEFPTFPTSPPEVGNAEPKEPCGVSPPSPHSPPSFDDLEKNPPKPNGDGRDIGEI